MEYEHNGRRVHEDKDGNLDWERYEEERHGAESWSEDRIGELCEKFDIDDPWNWELDDNGLLQRRWQRGQYGVFKG